MKVERFTIKRDVPKEVREMSRKTLGSPKGTSVILDKTKKKPKHRKRDWEKYDG